jgi:hypothetical protein
MDSNIDLYFVDEAPTPVFARLERAHEGVGCRMKMLRGVFVLGGIAAAHVAADQAQAQVNPSVAHSQTLLASICMRLDILDLIQVRALVHEVPLSAYPAGSLTNPIH